MDSFSSGGLIPWQLRVVTEKDDLTGPVNATLRGAHRLGGGERPDLIEVLKEQFSPGLDEIEWVPPRQPSPPKKIRIQCADPNRGSYGHGLARHPEAPARSSGWPYSER